ncbi:hypothetical protein HPB51_012169 [Rhipicephalus microplus]|uniref:F-box domain-containing protein n=1 Tax=Rhipicephalus microplus TaxID=6941 RepID=A0A9J6D9M3_RHIMP|nr:hypothetical protein HPB51_012169 [Rhipicephalus microplus]
MSDGTLALLPPEVLDVIFSYCDVWTLGRLSCVCKRFNSLLKQSYVWTRKSKNIVATNQRDPRMLRRSMRLLEAEEKIWQSVRWQTGRYDEMALLKHRVLYIPWLQLERDVLWYSQGSVILKYQRREDGTIGENALLSLRGFRHDVVHFVRQDDLVVGGGSDGCLCIWSAEEGSLVHRRLNCNSKAINSVDYRGNMVVTGSQDRTVNAGNGGVLHKVTHQKFSVALMSGSSSIQLVVSSKEEVKVIIAGAEEAALR